ncbi:MAG TPA: site-specific integrase [Miltoncostaeaceae bacterium]|nr:site-specific integrase [Miltoncostaeaceae bacterium]
MARGSIIERVAKDGARTFSIKYRDAAGRQVKRAVGPSRREAERALARALADVERGALAPSRELFAEYAERWLEEHRHRIERGTYLDYRAAVARLVPILGQRRLRDLTPQHLRDALGQLHAGGLSPKTCNNTVVPLRLMLAHAVEDGLLMRNPAERGRDRLRIKEEHVEQEFLSAQEVVAYLDAAPVPYRPIAELLVGTGARISEVLALEWADLDGDGLLIRRSLKGRGEAVGSTKNDRPRRVDLGPRLSRVLDDHRARLREHYDGPLMFPRRDGRYLDRTYVSSRWHHRALRDAGIERPVRLHDLRGSAVALWLRAGLPLVYAQRQLGHHDITVTAKHYGHLEREYLTNAAATAEAALWGAPG